VRRFLRIVEPQPHLRALVEVVGAQLHLHKLIFEIFEDDVRFDQDAAVVVERRHHGLGIEPGVPGLVVLELEDVDVLALPVEAFLGQAHARLLRADRAPVMIKLQHRHDAPLDALDTPGTAMQIRSVPLSPKA
jgi:hypothetical protein